MVYANDLWILLPTKDIYNTQMMLAAVSAAKDMYDKGQEQIKNFYTNYGDFTSPFVRDMESYDNLVTKPVQDMMNYFYDNGIDPVRNPEARAAMSRMINSVPVGDVNKLRQSAEVGKEYLKNRGVLLAKGLYNPLYENFVLGGRSFDDYSTLNDGIWNTISPSEYRDLNQYTTHIFDKIGDSFIGTDKDGYEWYGVTPEMGMQALTSDTIGGLLNSDLGRFHYNNARMDLIAQGNTNPTDLEVMDQFKRNIISANREAWHQNRRITEERKQQLDVSSYRQKEAIKDYYMRLRALDKSGSDGTKFKKYPYDFVANLFEGGVAGIFGMTGAQYDPAKMSVKDIVEIQRNKLKNAGQQMRGYLINGKIYTRDEALNKGMSLDGKTEKIYSIGSAYEKVASLVQPNTIDSGSLAKYGRLEQYSIKSKSNQTNITQTNEYGDEFKVTPTVASSIYNSGAIYNSMIGRSSNKTKTVIGDIKDYSNYSMVPTGGRLTYVNRNGVVKTMAQVIVIKHNSTGGVESRYTGYYDMNINSQRNTTILDASQTTRTWPMSQQANKYAGVSSTSEVHGYMPEYGAWYNQEEDDEIE